MQNQTNLKALSFYRQLLTNPKIEAPKARKMVLALFPECPASLLSSVDSAKGQYGKVIIKENPRNKALQKKISKKIALLMREGYPQDQAAAIAYSMVAPNLSYKKMRLNPKKIDGYENAGLHLADKFYRYTDIPAKFIYNETFKMNDILAIDFEGGHESVPLKVMKEFIADAFDYLEEITTPDEADSREWKIFAEPLSDHKTRLFFTLTTLW